MNQRSPSASVSAPSASISSPVSPGHEQWTMRQVRDSKHVEKFLRRRGARRVPMNGIGLPELPCIISSSSV